MAATEGGIPEGVEFKEAEREELQPTLIVGLGGTGKMVLARLKARYVETFGDVPQTIKLMALDIDVKEEKGHVGEQEIVLEPGEEFIDIGDVPAGDIINKLRSRPGSMPELRGWFNSDVLLQEKNLRRGGQQNRQLGRLALFWHLRTKGLKNRFESAIMQLRQQGLLARRGEIDESRGSELNVFVVSSLAGGTGSGAFIDIAYIVRGIGQGIGIGDTMSVIGILVTPRVFDAVKQENIQPNGLASLQELDYFMALSPDQRKSRKIDYGPFSVPCIERPFNICYLVDAISETGRTLVGTENLFPMLVDSVFIQSASRMGATAASMINNIGRVLTGYSVFSTFGVASLVFPARQIMSICAARVGRVVIDEHLLAGLSSEADADLATEVGRFLASQEFDYDSLVRNLTTGPDKRRILLNLRADDRLKDARLASIDKSQMYIQVTRLVDEISAEWEARAREQLATNRDELVTAFLHDPASGLHPKVEDLASNRPQGLRSAIEFLGRLRSRLETLDADLERERATAEVGKRTVEGQLRSSRDDFEHEVARAQKFLRFANPEAKRDQYLRDAQALLERTFQMDSHAAAKQMVANIVEAITRLRERLILLENNLRWVSESFMGQKRDIFEKEIDELDVVRRKPIVTKADVDAIYEEHKDGAIHRVLEDIRSTEGGMYSFIDLSGDEMGNRLFNLGTRALSSIQETRLEEVILEKEEEDRVPHMQWLEGLRTNAETFWKYREAEAEALAETLQVTGVEDTQISIYPARTREGESYCSTGDKHAITVLKMKHGLAYRNMAQYPSYRDYYKAALSKRWPVHIFPEFSLGDQRSRKAFILGHAYGFISRRGPLYYCQAADGGEPVRLNSPEEGLFDAAWRFTHDEELADTTEKRVEDHLYGPDVSDEARGQILEKVKPFLKRLEFHVREEDVKSELLADELRKTLEKHVRDLETMQKTVK